MARKTTEKLRGVVDYRGTLLYAAPEMLTKNCSFDSKIDSWSLGILLFSLLTGNLPFTAKNRKDLTHKILNYDLDFSLPFWNFLSFEAQDILD